LQAPLINIYSISVPKEITRRVVKVKVHRLVDGDIITISDYIMNDTVKIVEDDDQILIVVYKNDRTS